MLCRALFAVAVVSYVLCVLLLSGVQKDDLDAGTLRKLQRHNVNIADIDGKIREECFAKQNVASSTTQQVELKIQPNKSTTSPVSELGVDAGPSPAELRKILDYFKQMEAHKELNIEEATTKSTVIQNSNMIDLSKLPSSLQSRVIKEIASLSTASTINRVTKHKDKKVKTNHEDYEQSDDLQNIEKVQQESATQGIGTNKPITDKSNDVEYISKIVEQILARRKLNQESTTTAPPTTIYFDGNKLAQEIHSILTKNLVDKYPQNFYLNNFNTSERAKSPPTVEPKKKTEEKDIIDALISQLRNHDRLQPLTNINNEYVNNNQINKRIETEVTGGQKNALYSSLGGISNPNIIDSSKIEAVAGDLLLNKWQNDITVSKPKAFATNPQKQQTSTFNRRSGLDRTVSIQEVISKHFPYFFEDQNKQDPKMGSGVSCLIVNQPNDLCKTRNNYDFFQDNGDRSNWHYIIESLRKGELTLQDMQKVPSVFWPNGNNIKTNSQISDIRNDLSLDNQYKSEWLLDGRSGPIQFQLKNNQNLIQVPLNNKDPTMEGKPKNAWPYYNEDPKLKQQYIPVSKNILLHNPSESEKSRNQRLISNEEVIGVKPKNSENTSKFVQQLIISTNKDDPEYMKRNKNNQVYVINEQSKEDIGKTKTIPPGVIKQIADSVKEIVLRDLKNVISITTSAATTVSTTIPCPTTTTATTTTPATTPTTTQTTTKPTSTTTQTSTKTITTEKSSTTVEEDHVKIQEASKALEKFMEIFERFKSMKDSIVKAENITHKASMNGNHIENKEENHENPPPYPLYRPPYIRNQMKRQPLILDPYTDESTPEQIQNKVTKRPHGYALTLQTNSDEIPPLNVAVSKPLSMLNTIVVTPLPDRSRGRNLRQYSAEASRNRTPQRYQIPRTDYQSRYNLSNANYREPGNFKHGNRPKARINKKERNLKDRAYKQRGLHGAERFHEKLERADTWQRHSPGDNKCSGSKENCNEPVASRMQRPLINTGSSYDDTHFRNFLKTQQKVTDMLERILATNVKHIPRSAEVI